MKAALSRLLPQNFNDTLALVLMMAFLAMWACDAWYEIEFHLNDTINGAMIPIFTLIGQYYFRKKTSESG